MIGEQPDWSVLDMERLPEWPEYASAESSTPDGQRGVVVATMTSPKAEPVKVWLPMNMPTVGGMVDRLTRDAIGHLLSAEGN